MKKKLLIMLALVCAVVLCLCACGGGNNGGGGEQGGGGAPAAKGEMIDTGVVKGLCPDGWMYYQQTDMWGEKDADGNYPPDLTKMAFCKGGKDEWDLFSKPTVYAAYSDGEITDDTLSWAGMLLDESEEISVDIQGKTCRALHGKSLISEDNPEKDYWEYVYAFYPVDGGYIQVTVPLHCGEKDGVKVEDADVQAILSSLAKD